MTKLSMHHYPGMVLLTRNTEQVGNESPGYWNHAAIVVPNEWVVEGQKEPGMVIAVPWCNFFERYPEIMAIRLLAPEYEPLLAQAAIGRLGRKFLPVRFNCVGLVRECAESVLGRKQYWKRPDHLEEAKDETFWRKVDYLGYVRPVDWTAGYTTDPSDLLEEPRCNS